MFTRLYSSLALLALLQSTVLVAAHDVDCVCPDVFEWPGVVLNVFAGSQCAYPNGACTWDEVRPFFTDQTSYTDQADCASSTVTS